MKATIIGMLAATVMLSGCKTAEQKRLDASRNDQASCSAYGFSAGTQLYANCMMQLDMARNEEAAAKRLIRKQAECLEAQEAARNAPTGFAGGFLSTMNRNMACR